MTILTQSLAVPCVLEIDVEHLDQSVFLCVLSIKHHAFCRSSHRRGKGLLSVECEYYPPSVSPYSKHICYPNLLHINMFLIIYSNMIVVITITNPIGQACVCLCGNMHICVSVYE